jgi:SAM-dependent methyltransferase
MAVACRSCGAHELEPILSLGSMPLANALLSANEPEAPEPRYPLDLARCPGCALVQITETVPAELLFADYAYFSSFSDSFLRHAEELVARVLRERSLGPHSQVVEVGSNDGYLLQYYRRAGVPVLGIEPAANIAAVAREQRQIPTRCEFFSEKTGQALREEGLQADVLHAHNVMAHVADLNGFVRGVGAALKPTGVAVLEVHYVRDMIDRCEFDTIYHEHLCYFSLTALWRLIEQRGLIVQAVERVPVHGGSLRVLISHPEDAPADPSVGSLLEEERIWGVDRPDPYLAFATRVASLRLDIRQKLETLSRDGARIAAYGAAAKGAVLLNALGLKEGTISYVVDRSPHKQGRLVPGVALPIRPPEALLEDQPDYVLLLAWNLADEILEQQTDYRRRGGRFIIPVPNLKIA